MNYTGLGEAIKDLSAGSDTEEHNIFSVAGSGVTGELKGKDSCLMTYTVTIFAMGRLQAAHYRRRQGQRMPKVRGFPRRLLLATKFLLGKWAHVR